ncbi:acetyl-CoA C-acetyltransferase [Deinococcus sp. VB142]|uniref:Acetyl-CoA C-acetyltransferase n=1 Tax=Deinococcus sp. VB142 TaxID=3112952 RepID=A0AAU6Q7M8_9DEIO
MTAQHKDTAQKDTVQEVYIYDAVRTPRGRGRASGSLHEVKPVQLVVGLLEGLKERNSLDTAQVDDVILGCVTPLLEQGFDIARVAVLLSSWDESVPGVQLNRFCSSGLEAVQQAAGRIRGGWDNLIVAGGVESMSRVPMGSDMGAYMDPISAMDMHFVPQGISADLIATLEDFSREDVDAYALESQQRAAAAQKAGHFEKSILPVKDINGLTILDKDEYLRPETTKESLSGLKPAFAETGAVGFDAVAQLKYPEVESIHHVHTAGNSSGIVDGAALILLGSEEAGRRQNLRPRGRIVSIGRVGTEPTIMLTGPVPASKKALDAAGLSVEDIDLFEVNEAFAVVPMQFMKELNVPHDKVNVNGGSIALGHPLGATGAIIINTVLDELERQGKRYGLCTLCVGGGMGNTVIVERVTDFVESDKQGADA